MQQPQPQSASSPPSSASSPASTSSSTSSVSSLASTSTSSSSSIYLLTRRLENPPQMRSRHTASVVGDKLFVFAGDTGPGKMAMNDTYMLDLVNLEWTQCRTLRNPAPRSYHSASVIGNDRILVFGGYGHGYLNDLHCLQTTPTLSDFNSTRRSDQNDPDDLVDHNNGDVDDQDGGVYEWSRITASTNHIPIARCGHASAVIADQMYIFGGYNNDSKHLNDLHIFDPHRQEWYSPRMFGDIPSPRSYHSLSAVDPTGSDPRLFLFGGYQRGSKTVLRFNDVHCLDTRCMKWFRCTTFGTQISERSGHTMSVIDNQLYLFGGSIRMSAAAAGGGDAALSSTAEKRALSTSDSAPPSAASASPSSAIVNAGSSSSASTTTTKTTATTTATGAAGTHDNSSNTTPTQQHRRQHQHRNHQHSHHRHNNNNNTNNNDTTHRSSTRRRSCIKYLSDLHVLDVDTMTWREIPLLSSGKESLLGCGRRFHTASVHQNRLFIFGGHIKAQESNEYQFFNDVNVLGVGSLRADIAGLFDESPFSEMSAIPSRGIVTSPVDVRWPSASIPQAGSEERDGNGEDEDSKVAATVASLADISITEDDRIR